MAAMLRQILLAPDIQPCVVADCQRLIDQEVCGKSGVSGTAVKVAYKTVKSLAPGYLQGMAADPDGKWLIVGAIVAQVIGNICIRKIINIKV